MNYQKCHGKKPRVSKLKPAGIWIAECSCGCKDYRAGTERKRDLPKMWNELIGGEKCSECKENIPFNERKEGCPESEYAHFFDSDQKEKKKKS